MDQQGTPPCDQSGMGPPDSKKPVARGPGDQGREGTAMVLQVTYSVIAYQTGVTDKERTWTGKDKQEALNKVMEFMAMWPHTNVRLSEETYFKAE